MAVEIIWQTNLQEKILLPPVLFLTQNKHLTWVYQTLKPITLHYVETTPARA